MMDRIHAELSEMVIGCAYRVHKELGGGFLKKFCFSVYFRM